MAKNMSSGQQSAALLKRCRYGILATQSVEMQGFPFGSVTPYCLDSQGHPIILISALAQHTRNLQQDAHVSLTVVDEMQENDPLTTARLTILAKAETLKDTERTSQDYLSRFPEAVQFLALGDFSFYRLQVVRGYYVGGFGQISWVDTDELRER